MSESDVVTRLTVDGIFRDARLTELETTVTTLVIMVCALAYLVFGSLRRKTVENGADNG